MAILDRNRIFSGFYTFIIKYILSIYPLPETKKKKATTQLRVEKQFSLYALNITCIYFCLLSFISLGVHVSTCMHATYVRLHTPDARREHQVPWSWNYTI